MGLNIKELKIKDYDRVIEIQDLSRGLHAFIAIHDRTMGPGVGGTRILPYESREEALTDVLRLSKGMTYKAALANTQTGGSKSSLIIDPKIGKTRELLEAYAEAVNYLNGQHICAEDMNCTEDDLRIIKKVSPHVLGLTEDGTGDPSRFTAFGVFRSIQATALTLWGSESLVGKKVAVQGIGGVGLKLLAHLFWAGADLIVTDINQKLLDFAQHEYAAKVVSLDEILKVECDIFAPCARGGVLNKESIPQLKCACVVGAANNQLLEEEDAKRLFERGILYAPDYVANAGGLICIASGLDPEGPNSQKMRFKTNQIYNRLLEIYQLAEQKKLTPNAAANQLVESLLEEEKNSKNALV